HLLQAGRDRRCDRPEPLSEKVEDGSHTLREPGLGDDLLDEGGLDHGSPSSADGLRDRRLPRVEIGRGAGNSRRRRSWNGCTFLQVAASSARRISFSSSCTCSRPAVIVAPTGPNLPCRMWSVILTLLARSDSATIS